MAVKILGIHFTYNNALFRKLNFDSIMKSIKKSLNNWKWRGLALMGKIQIIKSFVVPKILYRAAVLSLERDFLKEIISVLYEFLWKGKDKVKRTAVISDIRDGGLRMVDIETMIKAQQIMVVKKYLDNSPTGWKNILSFHLRKVGGPFLFHCNFELDSLPLDLPVFYQNCLDAWSSINKSSPATSKQIANQILWNNKFIRIEKKSLYNKRLINCNFVAIRDLYDDDGNSITEQKSRIFKISPIDTFLLFQVLSAIPPDFFSTYCFSLCRISRNVKHKK